MIDQLPAMTIPWTVENSIVCFGTSITYGYGAREGMIPIGGGGGGVVDSSYPGFLSRKLKIKVFNQGYVGATSEYGLSQLESNVLSKKPVLVLMEFGANDFLRKYAVPKTDSIMSLMITRTQNYGAKVVLVSFIHPEMTKFMKEGGWTAQDSVRAVDYYNMQIALSKKHSVQIIEYPLRSVFGDPYMMSDRLHPNGAGYQRMFMNIAGALNNSFAENGMLK